MKIIPNPNSNNLNWKIIIPIAIIILAIILVFVNQEPVPDTSLPPALEGIKVDALWATVVALDANQLYVVVPTIMGIKRDFASRFRNR